MDGSEITTELAQEGVTSVKTEDFNQERRSNNKDWLMYPDFQQTPTTRMDPFRTFKSLSAYSFNL